MVERILEQAQAIRHVLSDDRRSSLSLTWQDMDVLKAVHEALKPVGDSGMEISTRHQPNAGDFVLWRVNSLHLPATVAGK